VAAAALGAWAVLRIGVLTHPLLPTMLPYSFDRFVTALSLGVAAGAIGGLLVASGRGEADGRSSVADPVLGPHQA
jgi:H+/Cl- antiporter ClcA